MILLPLLAQGAWWLASLPEAARFSRALDRVEATQRAVLARILRRNAGTRYGQQYGFAQIDSMEAYQARVPLVDYDDLAPHLDEMARGEPVVLTAQAPRCFMPTGGSTGGGKLIPYTPALRAEFQAGIAAWIAGLYRQYPAALAGPAYWSISPLLDRERRTEAGIPIGFDDDTAYLHPLLARLLGQAMAVPPAVAHITDMAAFRYVTLAFLLRARELRLISVWHPTFLLLLLEPLAAWAPALADDLARGCLSPPGDCPEPWRRALERALGAHPRRAAEITCILSEPRDDQTIYQRLWPRLAVISCWAHATARGSAEELQRWFPGVPLAPKGLLATEGMVSLPLAGHPGAAPALRSHFFEFLPAGGGPARAAWHLDTGGEYTVVLTTGGGLYRYRLGDVVRVVGRARHCPLVEFLGRDGRISDLYGEKLHEAQVAGVLARVLPAAGLAPAFMLLAPDGEPRPTHYTLFLAGGPTPDPAQCDMVCRALEDSLCANPHYAYCRRLGQLHRVALCWLGEEAGPAHARYQAACLARGQRAGEIKPAMLDAAPGWRARLHGARAVR